MTLKPRALRAIASLASVIVILSTASVGLGSAHADTTANPCQLTPAPTWTVDDFVTAFSDPHSLYQTTLETGAASYYNAAHPDGTGGYYGQGVDVALIDSGVSPEPGLDSSNVIYGPDLSFESNNPTLAHLDTFGHGTHMAGIIAAHGGVDPSVTPNGWNIHGMAPKARIVSIKVADSVGAVDVTQIIAGIDWAVTHRHDNGMNIRVINLSVGFNAIDAWQNDALSYAVEQAWKSNIVVVAAAGNDGNATQGLTAPAYNQDVIAVGAYDPAVQVATDFTSSSSSDNKRNPDIGAPGQSIGSLHVPGSYADQEILADCAATVAAGGTWTQPIYGANGMYLKGSGTSQAAAVVSGAVALVLSRNPGASPDQVKHLLKVSATDNSGPKSLMGEGFLNLAAAYSTPIAAYNQSHQSVATGGALDSVRGGSYLASGCTWGYNWANQWVCTPNWLQGNTDWFGAPVNVKALQSDESKGQAWKSVKDSSGQVIGESWNGEFLTGAGFTVDPQLANVWTGHTWSGSDWAGHTWSGHTWSGHTWSGNRWSGNDWSGDSWTGNRWSGHTWHDFHWG